MHWMRFGGVEGEDGVDSSSLTVGYIYPIFLTSHRNDLGGKRMVEHA